MRTKLFMAMTAVLLVLPVGVAHSVELEDSVLGTGAVEGQTFTIEARSGPSGENPSGFVSFNLGIGTIEGPVTLLCVFTDTQAVVIGEVAASSTGAPAGSGYAVHVQDAGQPPTGFDLLRLELTSFVQSDCTGINLVNPSAVTEGDIAVTNAEQPTPQQQITDLRGVVHSMNLPQALTTALDKKLQHALAAVNAGNTARACGNLGSFINQVRTQAGKKLTQAQADQLIDAANQIRQAVGC
jgi:hypothetical protein